MAKVKIHNRIKAIRKKETSITQTAMAELLGMRRQHYSQVERNLIQPSLERAYKIAEILGKDIHDLFYIHVPCAKTKN